MQQNGVKRVMYLDNSKFILIFLVVFAHSMEMVAFPSTLFVYKLIYTFHMPAFIFVTGYFARFSKKKIVFQLIPLYIVFQIMYTIFSYNLSDKSVPFGITFSVPYWLLWYLFAVIVYNILLPLLDQNTRKWQIITVLVAIVLSLLVGFDNNVGYYMSLSRIFVYLPFFIMGFYMAKYSGKWNNFIEQKKSKSRIFACIMFVAVVVVSYIFYLFSSQITPQMLYGANPYKAAGYTIWLRAFFLGIAIVWIVFLLAFSSTFLNYKIPILSSIGKNTLPVYLLHGFVIKYGQHVGWFKQPTATTMWVLLVFTLGILLVLGNPITTKIFSFVFFPWNSKRKKPQRPKSDAQTNTIQTNA